MEREQVCELFKKYIQQEQNIRVLEKYIYEYSKNSQEYTSLVYSIMYTLQTTDKKKSETMRQIVEQLYSRQTRWNHDVYSPFKKRQEEEDNFRLSPFEIEEGVIECKCGSKRTISFQRQTRSADEGSTTFAQCVQCGSKWRHNN